LFTKSQKEFIQFIRWQYWRVITDAQRAVIADVQYTDDINSKHIQHYKIILNRLRTEHQSAFQNFKEFQNKTK